MQKKEKTIGAMEELLAHHEKTIEDLSVQLAKQWDIIATIENKVTVLTKRFATLEENSLPSPHVAKPPHY